MAGSEENRLLLEELTNDEAIVAALEQLSQYEVQKRTKRLMQQLQIATSPLSKLRSLFSATRRIAAVLLFFIAAGSIVYFSFLYKKTPEPVAIQQERFKNDLYPHTNLPRLVLGNGRQIVLDSLASGSLIQGNASVTRLASGEIVYNGSGDNKGKIQYNTIHNPAGGRVITLALADGSRVWLNAASSITYPTVFGNEERKVSMSGEAYFEVAKTGTSFVVQTRSDKIEVLGTHFNINSYDDEGVVKTTLVEGKVRIGQAILLPGQQHSNGKLQGVNMEEVMAWKDGRFLFDGADIKTIMRQVAHWYDAEVVFEAAPHYRFVADIPRDVPVSELLKLLEATGLVHFTIEGKKITVMK